MAFGQAPGPPASARQIDELAALLERAGFSSFREARHPYGLTQRQAAGKFTAPEAAELIDRLSAAEIVQQSGDDIDAEVEPPRAATRQRQPAASRAPRGSGPNARRGTPEVATDAAPRPRSAASIEARRRRDERRAEQLDALSDAVIAAELERRGWCCIPPLQDEPSQA